MPISPARIAAFDILLQVETNQAYASELLHASRYEALSPADHGLATELVMGVLRWRSLLDREITKQSSLRLEKIDPEVLCALRLGAYQLIFLDRIPTRAAIHESVELAKRAHKRSAAPFVNAILRRFSASELRPDVPAVTRTEDALANRIAHPLWLVERWVKQFGFDAAARICEYDQKVPDTCIRLVDAAVEQELGEQGITIGPGHLLASARRVLKGQWRDTNAFREDRVAIQDEASQLVALLVGQGFRILDCCAAPGGKTRILAERNPSGTVTAVDLHPHRAGLLRKLVTANNICVIAADARQLPVTVPFDRVLADVPCSGTGTLARNPEIKWRLTPDDLAELQERQLAILQAGMQKVAAGGRLVYSTCSLEHEENSEVVEKALALDTSFRLVACREVLLELKAAGDLIWEDIDSLLDGAYLRTIPGVHPCDGFFAAVLERSQ